MQRIPHELRDVPVDEVRAHPEVITDLLFGEEDVSVILEKHGDVVRFSAMRVHDKDATRILREAKAEYLAKKARGYTREEAVADLEAVQNELTKDCQPEPC